MIGLACVLVSAAAFYFSLGLGEIWPLAWLAPVPVLWYAMHAKRVTAALGVAVCASALGGLNLLNAYLGVLPPPVLVLAILAPAILFGLAVLGARFVARSLGAIPAIFAFAALWAGIDFLQAFDPSGGSALTPAASQAAAPALMQIASLTGFSGVTFVMGWVACACAVALHTRRASLALLAVAAFATNLGFGMWRISTPADATMKVALIASDTAVGALRKSDEARALEILSRYGAEIRALRGRGVGLVVLPENLARLDARWRDSALAPLAEAARAAQSTVIVGANTDVGADQQNVAWAVTANGEKTLYAKRQLVPGLETSQYARGAGPIALSDGVMIAICKDLDFPEMIRADVAAVAPRLIAVPAWDFTADGWSHARIAILRGIENGVAVARTAREGTMTLSDRYGRLIALQQSGDAFATVIADLPVTSRPEPTLYAVVGQAFGWVCLLISAVLLVGALVASRNRRRGVHLPR